MMLSAPTPASPTYHDFLEISRACKFPEIKDFSSNLTTGWMCLIHSWIYGGPKAHLTHTEWDKNYGVKESLLLQGVRRCHLYFKAIGNFVSCEYL